MGGVGRLVEPNDLHFNKVNEIFFSYNISKLTARQSILGSDGMTKSDCSLSL